MLSEEKIRKRYEDIKDKKKRVYYDEPSCQAYIEGFLEALSEVLDDKCCCSKCNSCKNYKCK